MDVSKIKDIIKKSIINFSVELNTDVKNTQIIIYVKDDAISPQYKLLKEYKYVREINLSKEILGIKYAALDFLGHHYITQTFIRNSFIELSGKYNKIPQDLNIMILLPDTNTEPIMYLYNKTEPIVQLNMDDVFSQEKLIS